MICNITSFDCVDKQSPVLTTCRSCASKSEWTCNTDLHNTNNRHPPSCHSCQRELNTGPNRVCFVSPRVGQQQIHKLGKWHAQQHTLRCIPATFVTLHWSPATNRRSVNAQHSKPHTREFTLLPPTNHSQAVDQPTNQANKHASGPRRNHPRQTSRPHTLARQISSRISPDKQTCARQHTNTCTYIQLCNLDTAYPTHDCTHCPTKCPQPKVSSHAYQHHYDTAHRSQRVMEGNITTGNTLHKPVCKSSIIWCRNIQCVWQPQSIVWI